MAYATQTELVRYGISADALVGVSATDQNACLESASRKVDSYLRARYGVPLVTADDAVKEATCAIAAYLLLRVRGYDPQAPANAAIRQGYDDALQWLADVRDKKAHLNEADDATPDEIEGGGLLVGAESRGWDDADTATTTTSGACCCWDD